MAVRTPVYWDNGFKPMTSGMINNIVIRAMHLFATGTPPVRLTGVASNGNLNAMQDNRYQAGASTSRVDRFATEGETGNISLIAPIVYDHINQTPSSTTANVTDTNNRAFPVYLSADGLRPMTRQDFIDTFIKPALDDIYDNLEGGTYSIFLSGNETSEYTLAIADPVFENTTADTSLYTASGIGEVRDQPTEPDLYYLYKKNSAGNVTLANRPLYVDGDANLREYTDAILDPLLENQIKHLVAAESTEGYRFRYEIEENPTGTFKTCGDLIVDEILNGSSASGYTQRFVNANDYRTQEFPNGVAVPNKTYRLTLRKS